MTTNQTVPVTDEELDQMIWKLERDGGMVPRMLSLMRELREVRKAKREPVMYTSAETIAAARDGEHLLRTLSAPSGDCTIPLYVAPPAPVVPDEKPMPNTLKMYAVDAVAAIAEVRGWNACRAAMLNQEKSNG